MRRIIYKRYTANTISPKATYSNKRKHTKYNQCNQYKLDYYKF